MSTLKVEIVKIDDVQKHPNADRLDLVVVKGWNVVAGREDPGTEPRYKKGDIVIYIPIDSVLDPKLETFLFPPGSKITLEKSRVRTIKIRKAVSQGMVIDICPELIKMYPKLAKVREGEDVTAILGIVKYEPPAPPVTMRGMAVSKKKSNPYFDKYTDLENFKNYPDLFKEGELVSITEKLHGTSHRMGKLPTSASTLWKKFLKFLRLLPEFEYVYGSRSRQLQDVMNQKVYYSKNVYCMIFNQYKSKISNNEVVYGEIVGDGIQDGYMYGCKQGEWKFFAYDVKIDGKWLDREEFVEYCKSRDIPMVPTLYEGPFSIEKSKSLAKGDSTIGGQKVREGVVIKPMKEENSYVVGRKVLKLINDDYLLRNNTDFH